MPTRSGQARLNSTRSNASSSGRTKKSPAKESVPVQPPAPLAPPFSNPFGNVTLPRPPPSVASSASHPPRVAPSSAPSPAPRPSARPSVDPASQRPSSPSSARTPSEAEWDPPRPGPEAHSPRAELHNQGLHIAQLDLRLSDQVRHLARADVQIQLLNTEVERLTNVVSELVLQERPGRRRNSGPPCGMLTRRGTPCSNPRATCVYRAAGRHVEQKTGARDDSTVDEEEDQ